MTVAALYVDKNGIYPKLLGPELCWDEWRDARTYAGQWPVVAHPPCGPWGRLRHMCRRPQDKYLALHAVDHVRRFGGVLEHPAGSLLWGTAGRSGLYMRECLPKPGELPDSFGGYTIEVCQVDWGHVARKRTWLYLVDVPREALTFPPAREPTHDLMGRRGKNRGVRDWGQKECSAQQRRRTPEAFARWLIALAEQARPQRQRVLARGAV